MPGTFRSKSGATLSGHSDKWSNDNRRPTSHDAGQGSRGSRNMGTGMQGKLNTMPSQGIDTSKMKPEEKLKYFKSLGLMPGSEPTPEPEVQKDPVQNISTKAQELTKDLQRVFKKHPEYITNVVQKLKAVPKEQFKNAVISVYDTIQKVKEQSYFDPDEVLSHIQSAIDNSTYED